MYEFVPMRGHLNVPCNNGHTGIVLKSKRRLISRHSCSNQKSAGVDGHTNLTRTSRRGGHSWFFVNISPFSPRSSNNGRSPLSFSLLPPFYHSSCHGVVRVEIDVPAQPACTAIIEQWNIFNEVMYYEMRPYLLGPSLFVWLTVRMIRKNVFIYIILLLVL